MLNLYIVPLHLLSHIHGVMDVENTKLFSEVEIEQ